MPRLQAIDPQQATGKTKQLLSAVEEKFGMVPNLIRTLANSPTALELYLGMAQTLEGGELSENLRQQIALAVSAANDCDYCVAAHCAIGKSVGLNENELLDARQSSSPDSKVNAAIQFAKQIVEKRGFASDDDLAHVRQAGYGDGEITEIIAIVAWKTFANYFNHVAQTEIDFPAVKELSPKESTCGSCAT